MGVTFLHTADFHLGSQLKTQHRGVPRAPQILDEAVYTAVERLFDIAIEEAVDFVVIAGDLYDEDSRSVRANAFLEEQFSRLDDADIPAYVCYGNHDPVGSAPTYVELPENVHEFDHEEAEEALYPPSGTVEARIWGQSYRTRHESRKMYRSYTPADRSVPNIGVLHTGLNPDGERYVPVSRTKLESKEDIHYWALGHIHDARAHRSQQPVMYSGVPQGRDAGEKGLGGGYLVDIEASGEADIEFVPTSPVVWRTVEVDIGDESIESLTDVVERIVRIADDLDTPVADLGDDSVRVRAPAAGIDGYLCRWKLVGNGPVHEVLVRDDDENPLVEVTRRLRDRLADRQPFIWTETVRQETGPPVPSLDDLRNEDRVVDEFLTMIEDEIDDDGHLEQYETVVGKLWTRTNDHEDTAPDELALTDEVLADLVERARERVTEQLALERANS